MEDLSRYPSMGSDGQRAVFANFIAGVMDRGLKATDVCEVFDVSVPSVNRWRSGESAPVLPLQMMVMDAFGTILQDKNGQ